MNTTQAIRNRLSTTECYKRGHTYLPTTWVADLREARFRLASLVWGKDVPTLSKRDRKALVKAIDLLDRLNAEDDDDDDPFR